MKILVTGGSGYIGSVLVPFLLEKGCEVTVLDNLMYGQTSLLGCASNPNFKFVYGNVNDDSLLANLCFEKDVVIPLAALVGASLCDKNWDEAWRTNSDHIENILSFAGKECKIVYPTTNSGYGIGGNGFCDEESPLNPLSTYGETKMNAEKAVVSFGGISFRLATVFGASPRMRTDLLVNDFVIKAKRDRCIVLFEEHFRRNYIHVKDVCEAFWHGIANYDTMKGQVYNLGLSTANLTKRELAEKVKNHLPDTVIISSEIGSDPDKRDYIVSNAKLEATGWKPRYTLDDGIREVIQAYDIIKGAGDTFRND
jgi:nucleoside-diphosphate-sugar epimerase